MSSCGRVGICYMSALVMVILCGLSSVQLSHSVVSDSLQSHGLQHARLLCPSPTPGACSNSCPLSWWCHPTISSCRPLLLLHSILLRIKIFTNESVLRIRWPKYWSFNFSISLSSDYSGSISLRIDWFNLLVVQGTLKNLLQQHSSKASIIRFSAFFMVQISHNELRYTHTRVGWALHLDWCPYKKKETQTEIQTQREDSSREDRRGRWKLCCHKSRDVSGLPANGRGKGRSPIEGLEGAWPCWHLAFRLPALRMVRE